MSNQNTRRHIVSLGGDRWKALSPYQGLWALPSEWNGSSFITSFDLLGESMILDPVDCSLLLKRGQSDDEASSNSGNISSSKESVTSGSQNSGGEQNLKQRTACLQEKLSQGIYALCSVFEYHPDSEQEGMEWLGDDIVRALLIITESFASLEQIRDLSLSRESLWRHSLRTGCLAGLIAKVEHVDESSILHSCLAGLSHDIGMVILAASFGGPHYEQVMKQARQKSLPLADVELRAFGVSHEMVGGEFLQRKSFAGPVVEAVMSHDDPFGVPFSGFSPTTAVYAANMLEGGGWPQDSDGVPSSRALEYLTSCGFVHPWEEWSRCLTQLNDLEVMRV